MDQKKIEKLINKKVVGYGVNIDVNNVLSKILKGIINLATSKVEVDDFEEFYPSTSYSTGDVVRKDGSIYQFTSDHDGEWDDNDVEQTNVFTLLTEQMEAAITATKAEVTRQIEAATTATQVEVTSLSSLTTAEEALVWDAYEQGLFEHILFVTNGGENARPIYWGVSSDTLTVSVYNPTDGTIIDWVITEPTEPAE